MIVLNFSRCSFACCTVFLLVTSGKPQHTGLPYPPFFREGSTYTYRYNASQITRQVGEKNQALTSGLHATGVLKVTARGPVNHTMLELTLQNLQLEAINATDTTAMHRETRQFEEAQMQIKYYNGIISKAYLNPEDPVKIRNIMRGIASMLGSGGFTGVSEAIENDISGSCPTKYLRCRNKYRKTKNLQNCIRKQQEDLINVPILFQGTLTCLQTVVEGTLADVKCLENLAIGFFETTSFITETKTTLELIDINSDTFRKAKAFVGAEASMEFESPSSKPSSDSQTMTPGFEKLPEWQKNPTTSNMLEAAHSAALCYLIYSDCPQFRDYQLTISLLENFYEQLSSYPENTFHILALLVKSNLLEGQSAIYDKLPVHILNSSDSSDRSKMAAMDSYRLNLCQLYLKQKARQFLSSLKESTPVKIQAFLALVRCLTEEDLSTMQLVLSNPGQFGEVANFMVSYIKNTLAEPYSNSSLLNLFPKLQLPNLPLSSFRSVVIKNYESGFELKDVRLNANLMLGESDGFYVPRCANSEFILNIQRNNLMILNFTLFEVGICMEDLEDAESPMRGGGERKTRSLFLNRSRNIDAYGDVYFRSNGRTVIGEILVNNEQRSEKLNFLELVNNAIEAAANGEIQEVPVAQRFLFFDARIGSPSVFEDVIISFEAFAELVVRIFPVENAASVQDPSNNIERIGITVVAKTIEEGRLYHFINDQFELESGYDEKVEMLGAMDMQLVRDEYGSFLEVLLPHEQIPIYDVQKEMMGRRQLNGSRV